MTGERVGLRSLELVVAALVEMEEDRRPGGAHRLAKALQRRAGFIDLREGAPAPGDAEGYREAFLFLGRVVTQTERRRGRKR